MTTPQNRRKTGARVPNGKATQFKPGQSGNPGGRPKLAPLSNACRDVLAKPVPDDPENRTYAQVIAQTLADKAVGGDLQAAREIADRAEGRPRQSLEIENGEFREAFDRMTDEQLLLYAKEGKLPPWFPRQQEGAN